MRVHVQWCTPLTPGRMDRRAPTLAFGTRAEAPFAPGSAERGGDGFGVSLNLIQVGSCPYTSSPTSWDRIDRCALHGSTLEDSIQRAIVIISDLRHIVPPVFLKLCKGIAVVTQAKPGWPHDVLT